MLLNGDGSAEEFSADPASRPTRAWRGFRRWRRSRPFWGGLFLLLSGIEFYVSAHMDLAPLKVSFGAQGFLSWLIPLAVLLCGLLTWLTPAQRVFYGIIGAVTSVAALIALNLGGFFVGMLLGMVGGALAVAWAPGDRPLAEPPAEPPAGPTGDIETTDVLPTGPLTDQLPTSQTSPLGVPPVQGRHAADPPGSRPLTLLLLVAAVTAALLALPHPPPAAAAPCTSSPPGSTAPKPPPPPPSPSASASPSASPSPTGGGNPISDFFHSVGKLLGIGSSSPAAAPAQAPAAAPAAPAAAPAAPAPAATKPKPAPSCSTPPSSPATGGKTAPKARALAVPAGQPMVNKVPSKQIAALLTETGVSFNGVVDLPVQGGTIRALQFTLSQAVSTPFELQVPVAGAGTMALKSSKLTVSGNVTFYASRIQGFALGLLWQDYTPDSPPLLVPPIIFFTSAVVDLVFVHADTLTAPNLHIGFN